ncbi:MAG: class I SAM-dependent methyltransferase [Lautropia sp.]
MNSTLGSDASPSYRAAGDVADQSADIPADDHGRIETRLGAVERCYRQVAPIYDFLFGKVLEPGRRALAQVVAAQSPATLLEVGVGSGLTLPLYPAGTRITGIDLSPDMLRRAEQRAARLGGRRIELSVMNAEQMRFADASFDCVAVPYTLSVSPDTDQLVREIRRVCKPGGTIVIVNHFSGGRIWSLIDRAARPLTRRVGVHADFSFDQYVLGYDWDVIAARPVNIAGLSTLVEIRNRVRS